MSKAVGIGLVILVIVLGVWSFGKYNGLVSAEERVNEAWSQVENVYGRRMDLIPNLVETVKGVAEFEKETFTQVAEARASAGQVQLSSEMLSDPQAFQQFEQSQSALSSALSRLLVTVERYPDLKAQSNFADLQAQLEGTENRIAVERRRFNEVARAYNTQIRQFPDRLVASIAGFDARAYFEAREGADTPPQVSF
jgi:LemA protein